MKITAILVTHNEAAMLTDWLQAVSSWADELVIGLHDCSDNSYNTILEYYRVTDGDNLPEISVLEFAADDVASGGFSFIKNKLSERVSGDWIVSLDTDEEMTFTREQLDAAIEEAESKNLKAIQTYTYEPRVAEGERLTREELRLRMPSTSNLYHWRIYKAHAGVRWVGMIHEALHYHGQEINQYTLWQREFGMFHFGPGMSHLKNREKSDLLYCELICRAIDFPHLQRGTNHWWFDTHYPLNEKHLRARQDEFWRRRGEPKYASLLDPTSREIWDKK